MKALMICMFAFANIFYGTDAVLKTHFIEDLCFMKERTTIYLKFESSGIIMSVPRYSVSKNFSCEVTLLPKRANSVGLAIYKYDVRPGDQLTIQDSDRHTIGLLGWGTFKDEKKYIMSDGKIMITYRRNEAASITSNAGFQFTYTQLSNEECLGNEFQCKNKKCILKSLACDGHNHCGDNSDQLKCIPDETGDQSNYLTGFEHEDRKTSVAWISLIIIASSVIFLTLIIVLIVVLVRRSRAKKAQQPAVQENQPGGNIPLHSVSSTIPPNAAHPMSGNELQRSVSAIEQRESLYNRVRRSLRGQRRMEAPTPVHQEPISVPSMYPNLNQPPSAPHFNGVDNPEFHIEE